MSKKLTQHTSGLLVPTELLPMDMGQNPESWDRSSKDAALRMKNREKKKVYTRRFNNSKDNKFKTILHFQLIFENRTEKQKLLKQSHEN